MKKKSEWKEIKSEEAPEKFKKAAESNECNDQFHVYPCADGRKLKIGDYCKCGKDRLFGDLLDKGLH